ncbi:MAG: hypothetical protein AAF615_00685 [Pseudomonadota bacterium]
MDRWSTLALLAVLMGVSLVLVARPVEPSGVQVDLFLAGDAATAAARPGVLDRAVGAAPVPALARTRVPVSLVVLGQNRLRLRVAMADNAAAETIAQAITQRLHQEGVVPRLALHTSFRGDGLSLALRIGSAAALLALLGWGFAFALGRIAMRGRVARPPFRAMGA